MIDYYNMILYIQYIYISRSQTITTQDFVHGHMGNGSAHIYPKRGTVL